MKKMNLKIASMIIVLISKIHLLDPANDIPNSIIFFGDATYVSLEEFDVDKHTQGVFHNRGGFKSNFIYTSKILKSLKESGVEDDDLISAISEILANSEEIINTEEPDELTKNKIEFLTEILPELTKFYKRLIDYVLYISEFTNETDEDTYSAKMADEAFQSDIILAYQKDEIKEMKNKQRITSFRLYFAKFSLLNQMKIEYKAHEEKFLEEYGESLTELLKETCLGENKAIFDIFINQEYGEQTEVNWSTFNYRSKYIGDSLEESLTSILRGNLLPEDYKFLVTRERIQEVSEASTICDATKKMSPEHSMSLFYIKEKNSLVNDAMEFFNSKFGNDYYINCEKMFGITYKNLETDVNSYYLSNYRAFDERVDLGLLRI